MKNKTRYIIGLPEAFHKKGLQDLVRGHVEVIKGMYTHLDGTVVMEDSALLTETSFVEAALLSNSLEQESFLEIDENDQASLIYASGEIKTLGTFSRVCAKKAFLSEGFSIINGEYYTCV